jgi:thiamine-phosphate pyrophosphorylase
VTRQCHRLRALCREFGTIFIINDNIDLAVETDADGVHIGRDDATLQMARRALGPDKIIGVSCYDDWSRAAAAAAGGADYLAFGSFYPSKTKPAAVRADMGLLRQAKQQFLIPVVAIGGIDLENAPQLIHEGADALAVISDLFGADDIVARAISYKKLFDDHVR